MNKLSILALIAPALLLAATAGRADTTSDDALLFEATDRNVTVVHFAAGKDEFTAAEQTKILEAVNEVKKAGKISNILVAAWADKEYPGSKDEKLTRDDEALAKGRAAKIKGFLKDKKIGASIDTYSMAIYPSWLSRTFRTKEARLKQAVPATSLIGRSRDTLALEYYGKMLRDRGGPSTAVVVIREKSETGAH